MDIPRSFSSIYLMLSSVGTIYFIIRKFISITIPISINYTTIVAVLVSILLHPITLTDLLIYFCNGLGL